MKILMKSKNKQNGLSSLGWIVVIGLFALLTIAALKVFPMYYDNYKVKVVLESLSQDTDVDAESTSAIWASLSERLYAEAIESVQREHVSITQNNGQTNVTISYETRDSYFANLFIGAKFSQSVVIDR